MPSSYQMERLLDRLRRLRDWLPWPAGRRWAGADPVRLSAAARERAAPAAPPGGPPSVEAVRDRTAYPPRVEAERERRAGSFMEPPYPDEPLPEIPKVERATPRRRPARDITSGD